MTASALIVHAPTRRVLLRWHERQQRWLQVGGHADAEERDPFDIAMRDAAKETGLRDLVPWPGQQARSFVHLVIVPVPATPTEDAHGHADLRYVFSTDLPAPRYLYQRHVTPGEDGDDFVKPPVGQSGE